jgi:tetratricopeptide (TPR) repeat protein
MAMNCFQLRSLLLVVPAFLAISATASPQQSASVTDAEAKAPGASLPPVSPIGGQVFAFPVATKSAEARKLVEIALDQYENVLLDNSVESARKATEKDPQFALAYAVWSFAARRTQPNPEALRKAEVLAANAPADERLLVTFLANVQKDDMLPAIVSMNDLLARFPNNAHALYLTSEWLYFQQDYDRSVKMMEQIIALDPKFAPAYNMLGYGQVEAGNPDPVKAIGYLKKYAALEVGQPNPEDSLGEVSRYAGDDQSSIEHYSAALKLAPKFITSRLGLGDTYTLMGNFSLARSEYDQALAMSTNDRDRFHVYYQRALVNFWEGKSETGLQELAELERQASAAHEPYSVFEIQEARVLLAPTAKKGIEKLQSMERIYLAPVEGMSDADRNPSLAAIWRDEVRIYAEQNQFDAADETVQKLEKLAAKSRDLVVENCYESARGYVFFAQHDFQSAEDELSADPHSPLAVKRLVVAREKLGDSKGAESAKLRLKYLRAPTAEWFLATHVLSSPAN